MSGSTARRGQAVILTRDASAAYAERRRSSALANYREFLEERWSLLATAANNAGFRYFTSIEAFQAYVETEILASEKITERW